MGAFQGSPELTFPPRSDVVMSIESFCGAVGSSSEELEVRRGESNTVRLWCLPPPTIQSDSSFSDTVISACIQKSQNRATEHAPSSSRSDTHLFISTSPLVALLHRTDSDALVKLYISNQQDLGRAEDSKDGDQSSPTFSNVGFLLRHGSQTRRVSSPLWYSRDRVLGLIRVLLSQELL